MISILIEGDRPPGPPPPILRHCPIDNFLALIASCVGLSERSFGSPRADDFRPSIAPAIPASSTLLHSRQPRDYAAAEHPRRGSSATNFSPAGVTVSFGNCGSLQPCRVTMPPSSSLRSARDPQASDDALRLPSFSPSAFRQYGSSSRTSPLLSDHRRTSFVAARRGDTTRRLVEAIRTS